MYNLPCISGIFASAAPVVVAELPAASFYHSHHASAARAPIEVVGTLPPASTAVNTLILSDTVAYLGEQTGVSAADLTNPAQPQRRWFLAVPGTITALAIVGAQLYTAALTTDASGQLSGGALFIIAVDQPLIPHLRGTYLTSEYPRGLQVVNQHDI